MRSELTSGPLASLIATSSLLAACGGPAAPDKVPAAPVSATPATTSAAPSALPHPSAPAPASEIVFDASFGEGGTFTLETPKVEAFDCTAVEEMEIGPDGSVYVLATLPDKADPALGGCDSVVIKLTPAGKADASFGRGGLARASRSHGTARALALAPDGSVLVATRYFADDARGTPSESVDLHFAAVGPVLGQQVIAQAAVSVVKLTPKGTRDEGFGSKGEARITEKEGLSPARIRVEPDGAVTVVGLRQVPKLLDTGEVVLARSDVFQARITAKGARDKALGKNGVLTSTAKGVIARALLGATADGGLLVAEGKKDADRLIKLGPKLDLDPAYAGARIAHPEDAVFTFALSRSGAGFVGVTAGGKGTVGRFLPDGKADAAFAGSGSLAVADLPPENPLSLIPAADGGLVTVANGAAPRVFVVGADGKKGLEGAVLAKPKKPTDPSGRSRLDAAGKLLVAGAADGRVIVSRYVLPR